MQYGQFCDARREFVIHRPDTPYPWINYLGSEDFFALVSNTSGGYCFYRDARLLRLTRYRYNNVPTDSGGQYFYIRDGEEIWTPGWMPVKAALDAYECRHGMGYTAIASEKNGLKVSQTMLVPRGETAVVTRLTLENLSDACKEADVYSLVEFCLWNAMDDSSNFQRNFSTGEVEVHGSAIYHKTEYRERRNHYALYAVNAPIEGFDTDREAFVGMYNGFDCPDAVRENRSRNSIASGWAPIGSHHLKAKLAPGEKVSYIFILAYCENPRDQKFESHNVINKAPAKRIMEKFADDAAFDAAMDELRAYWDDLLGIYQAKTGEDRVDRIVNIWNQYQCMVTFNMSRSASYFESGIGRGMGFRDSTQDLLGFVHLIPDRARERIIDIASTQFPDGSAYHQYQPLTKRGNDAVGSGFNDDPLWLIFGVAAYLKETGDESILKEPAAYDSDFSKAEPLMEHLKKSFHFTLDHLGPHGLPLIGRADWNDCLNLNCFSREPGESFQTCANFESGVAESVFIAGMFVGVCDDYARLCRIYGWDEEAAMAEKAKVQMEKTVLEHGWDGEWFLRAYDAFGHKIGSSECEEGRIYIEPQGFCVMAGIGVEQGLARKALDSVREHLLCEHGVAIHTPPYTVYHEELGEISSYPPGYKENGGIFCHNNPWIVLAETVLNNGDNAFDVYRRTCPGFIEDQQLHRTEPYVYAQMIAGPYAPKYGQAKNSWLTGTAAWTFYAMSQGILGVKPDYDGLRIEPCLPGDMKELSVIRRYRGNTYRIHVVNEAGGKRGTPDLTVNGKPIEGTLIPAVHNEGKDISVEVHIR